MKTLKDCKLMQDMHFYEQSKSNFNLFIEKSKKVQLIEIIQTNLIEIISELLEVKPEQIDIFQPLSSFNLDSVEALILAGELSKRLGYHLYPTLIHEHQSIKTLAHNLAEELKTQS